MNQQYTCIPAAMQKKRASVPVCLSAHDCLRLYCVENLYSHFYYNTKSELIKQKQDCRNSPVL